MNLAPLQLTPMYTPISEGGIGDGQYWNNKSLYNTTEYSQKMLEYTSTVNTLFEYGVPFNTVIKSRWPGAVFTLFDVHSLLVDIYKNPESYLDAPYNVTGYYNHCFIDGRPCVNQSDLGPLSGFLWYDELHPSYKTGESLSRSLFVSCRIYVAWHTPTARVLTWSSRFYHRRELHRRSGRKLDICH